MRLNGSCHCRAVRFSVESRQPVPYQLCYCTICSKTQGGGGYAINLAGDAETLEVEGREHTRSYHAVMREEGAPDQYSEAERVFCGRCGSALWLYDKSWPELIHPFASAIDTELPIPPERTHLMLAFKANWVVPRIGKHDQKFDEYPTESIADWHQRLGLEDAHGG